jgi:GTPase
MDVLVEDLFRVEGRGVVVGTLRSGDVRAGDRVIVTRPDGATLTTVVRAIEFSTPSMPGAVPLS